MRCWLWNGAESGAGSVPRASSSDTNIHQVVRASFSRSPRHFKPRINFTITSVSKFLFPLQSDSPHSAELMEIPNDEPQALNMTEQEPPRGPARGTTACVTGPRCYFEEWHEEQMFRKATLLSIGANRLMSGKGTIKIIQVYTLVLTEDKNKLSAFSLCPSLATHFLFLKNKSQHLFKLTIDFNVSNERSCTVIIISSLLKEAVTWKVTSSGCA